MWLWFLGLGLASMEIEESDWATDVIEIWHDDDGETPCLGLPGGSCASELDIAIDRWNAVHCGTAPTLVNRGYAPDLGLVEDGRSAVLFHAVDYQTAEEYFDDDGQIVEQDMVLPADVPWVASGDACNGQFVLARALAVKLGQTLRLQWVCDSIEQLYGPCPSVYEGALMMQTAEMCAPAELNWADIALFGRKYGRTLSVDCNVGLLGQIWAEETLRCSLPSDLGSAQWAFGLDGTWVDGIQAEHVFESAVFRHSIYAQATEPDGCPAYVLPHSFEVCPPLEADIQIVVEDAVATLRRQIHGNVATCDRGHDWRVTAPDGEVVYTGIDFDHDIELEQSGDYTATLTVYSELSSHQMTETFGRAGGCSCQHGGPPAPWAVLALVPLWIRRTSA